MYRDEILRLAETHGMLDVRVFGSLARGTAGPDSDLDLLVHLGPQRSLLDRIAFWQAVEKLVGCKVDVVNDRGIKPRMREAVLADAVPL
jgi:predicted nucleotidyltransferase